jgi:hypothetical protein
VLRPGGAVVWVVMPPVCPWELTQAFRGHVSTARRRLKKEGTLADVESAYVRIWYHSASKMRRALGPAFRDVSVRAFCLVAPPSFFHGFTHRHPGMTQRMMQFDDLVAGVWPFNQMGDFIAVSGRYFP